MLNGPRADPREIPPVGDLQDLFQIGPDWQVVGGVFWVGGDVIAGGSRSSSSSSGGGGGGGGSGLCGGGTCVE